MAGARSPDRQEVGAADLRAVLEVARGLTAAPTLERLRRDILPQLRRLVACDLASFNEISLEDGRAVVAAADPPESVTRDGEAAFGTFAFQNPLIAAAQGPGPARVRKFSDFITRRQLHGLDLYDLVYRGLGVEHQIAFTLPAPARHVTGFALSRDRRDFTERDRAVLEAIRPFVVQAYADTAARVRVRATLAALERASDLGEQAIIVLGADGRVELATRLATRWLGGLGAPDGGALPEPLAAWREDQRCRARDGIAPPERLELRTADGAVTARFVAAGADQLDAIVLERPARIDTAALRGLGLTRREAEVLRLIARGLSNGQIAGELTVSQRTVAKHLEHVYRKLDVRTRTAAVARATNASDGIG